MSKIYIIPKSVKKFLCACLIATCFLTTGISQDYNTGIGVRLGFFNGLTVKHFVGSNTALEGLLDTRWNGFQFTGLYEKDHEAFDAPRLHWYYGVGGHIGTWNGDNTYWGNRGTNYTVVGIDGILGIEYNFVEIPINIGLDWKPAFNFVGYTGFWGDGGALSVRYVF